MYPPEPPEGEGQEQYDTAPPSLGEGWVQNQLQLDLAIITPQTDKKKPDSIHPLENITRDVVLSNLDPETIDFMRGLMELIVLAHIAEQRSGTRYKYVKAYFGSILQSLANLKRAESGFTAQLIRTNRIEQLSALVPQEEFVGGGSAPRRRKQASPLGFLGALFRR